MHITTLLKQTDKPVFSLEILPKAGITAGENLNRYRKIFGYGPLFVDIPYHAGRSYAGFSGQNPTVFPERPRTIVLSELLIKKYALKPQPHILCVGFTPEETEKNLLRLHEAGVRNLLLLHGDETTRTKKRTGKHEYAFQLVKQVKALNAGINYLNEKIETRTDFCVGVGGYPEPAIADFALSIRYLKQKADAGADFIITQLFFDNERFFAFEKACRTAGISVPIIPGISPLTSFKLLEKLPEFFKVSVPESLQKQIWQSAGKTELEALGVNWAVNQAKELNANGFNCVHFFALSRPEILERVLARLNKKATS